MNNETIRQWEHNTSFSDELSLLDPNVGQIAVLFYQAHSVDVLIEAIEPEHCRGRIVRIGQFDNQHQNTSVYTVGNIALHNEVVFLPHHIFHLSSPC